MIKTPNFVLFVSAFENTRAGMIFCRTKRSPGFRHTRESGYPGFVVTPVKTGVHPPPRNLDTVFQRYDGRCPSPGFPPWSTGTNSTGRE